MMKLNTLGRACMIVLLISSLIGSSFGNAFGAAASDISGHWAEKQLLEWQNKGLIKGYSDGSLKPDKPITRGELIALTNRALGFTEEAAISFTDLRASDWAYKDVAVAVKAGYLQGNADGTIGANRQISRQEAAVMMSRLLKLEGGVDTAITFSDADKIANWAKAAVGAVAAEQIMIGDSKQSFRPKASMTRAEAVVVLDRSISSHDGQQISYDKAGVYGPDDNVQTVKKDVIVNVPGVTLRNMKIEGNLLLAAGIGEGDVTLNHVTVLGKTTVNGGGANSIHFLNSKLAIVIVDKKSGSVRVVLEGSTTVASLTVLTPAILSLDDDAVIESLVLEAITQALGQGTIKLAIIHEGAKSSTFARQPLKKEGAGTGGSSTTGTPGPTTSPEPTQQNGTVNGHVFDPDNIGIEGAEVKLVGSVTMTAASGQTGTFTFSNVPIGTYKIIVSKAHYTDVISSPFNVTSGATSVVDVTIEPGSDLSVVANGQANAVIVVDDTKLSSSANTLAEYVKKSTGADLPIMTTAQLTASGNTYNGDVRIYIGKSVPGAEAAVAAKMQSLNDDGFVIMPYGNDLSISGPTGSGTEFGVLEFLERYVGVRWLMPGPDGEDVPQHNDVVIAFTNVIDEPAAISRHFFGTEAWYTLQTTADWAEHNRMHDAIKFHHYLNVLFDPQVFATHPEYYPGGVVPTHPYAWQPCLNDDTAAAAIWRIKDYFHNFPDAQSFSLGINDSDNYCAADKARANGKLNSVGVLDMSDVYYAWVNKVVEGVLQDYPDKYFGLLAYWNVYDPPSTVKLNSHVIPYITDDRLTWIDPDMAALGNDITEKWQLKADNIGFYEYLFGTPYNLPRVYMNQMADNYKYAEEHGVIAHVAELYPNFGEGPKPWLSAKLQWNPDQDVDLLLDEWYKRTVGAAASDDLKSYYELWENFWTVRILNTDWYLDWKNKADRANFLPLQDHRYLTAVTKADLTQSRSLLESVVAKAVTAKQKIRAEKLLRAFELFEASALSYPRGAVSAPTNEQDALAMLADLKQSFDMAMKRQVLTDQFKGDPILNLTSYSQYSGKWDGIQTGLIAALQSYANTITDPDNEFLAEFQRVQAYIDSIHQYSATAVKTTASKSTILSSLDFSQGPWVNAVPITEFLRMTSTEAPPAQTRMYLLWDNDNLYVGYENFDPNMSGIIMNDDAPNGWWRVADDSVETYVTGDVAGGYTGYFTNPKAVKFIYNSSSAGPVPGVDNRWQASAQIGTDRWNVIQVIPFSSIGVDPSTTKSLMGFFFRNYHGQSVYLGWGGGAPWTAKDFRPVHLVEGNNLVTNPSIEDGLVSAPWLASEWFSYYTDQNSTVLRTSAFKRTGGFSLETSVTDPYSSPFKVTSITPGKYKAVLNYFVPMNASVSGSIQLVATISNGNGSLDSTASVERPVSWMPGRWVQFDYTFDVEPDYNGEVPDTLILKINHSGFGLGEKLYIDDVSVYKLSD
ncbi:DUF4838 domain-containing protein [Cohnella soli]|uniref:DUF4838 domain-containing protein n=1 Tax=Cohnella soli TaxID=425005 RepID=A0ABW0HSS0_9BACL